MSNKAQDIFGDALQDYFLKQHLTSPLLLHNSYGDIEEMPVDVFFRDEGEFTDLELIALSLCDGKVLDIGAGAGTHSLYLQERGFEVTALEISARACAVMQHRDVQHILHADFFTLNHATYDTLLFLMNGIGIVGTVDGFRDFLQRAKSLMSDRGQLLFDSSDILYLYEDYHIPLPDHYYGEISFQYEYKGKMGLPFKWLYLDQDTLIRIAHEENWVVQILYEDDNDQYLARMEPRKEF